MADLTLAVCIYNAERYIEETLRSILAQTVQDFHLLIVNDCSTDNSLSIVKGFFCKCPRQHEIVSFDENMGIGYARHFAERHADTRYMMFLDADDCLYSTAIEKMYDRICADTDLMAVGCYLEYMDSDGRKIGGGIYLGETTKKGFYEKAMRNKRIFIPVTTVYDRQIALSLGGFVIDGFPNGKLRYQDYCEELDLWTRMSDLYTEGKAIIVVPEILGSYRKSEGLSSGTFPMILKMRYVKQNLLRRRAGQKELTFMDFYAALTSKEIRQLQRDAKSAENLRNGMFYLHRKQPLKAIGAILRSIYWKPSYIVDKIQHNIRFKK